MIQVAFKVSGLNSKKAILIGDQLETDIRMGINAGIDTLLVLTGISTKKDVEKSEVKPTYVVSNLSEVL
jgi:4-nitrophenyl phosphatase